MARRNRFGTACWFCGKQFTKHRPRNKHHIVSKRYGKRSPIHFAHMDCHHRFNVEVDNPQLEFIYYLVVMELAAYGYLVFAPLERGAHRVLGSAAVNGGSPGAPCRATRHRAGMETPRV